MAWQIPLSTSQDATVAPLGTTDDVFVASDVTIASKASFTIWGQGSDHEAIVYGTVISIGQVAILLGELDGENNTVSVKSGGEVHSLEASAVAIVSSNSFVRNDGLITAAGAGVSLESQSLDSTSIVNTGTIDVGGSGIFRSSESSETFVVRNSGIIRGSASFNAESAADGRDLITNTGKMIGNVFLGGGDDLYDGRQGTVQGNVIAGAGKDRLYSGAGNTKLFGEDGDDTLMGGADADYLSGGSGSDRASYASATKAVVVSLSNPSINAGDAKGDTFNSIENLSGSNYNDILNGSSANNAINGGAGNDAIKGYAGIDFLTGGSGADLFIFNTAPNGATNIDTITDFSVAADTIQLDNAVFAALTATGTLAAAAFRANATGLAADSSDRIIYDTDDGELYYDAHGNGAGAPGIAFARLVAGLSLTNADFVVI
ncbi:calcium-binding protein [Mesorhizobium sp. IMUNJ 23232]|uniref:calcium-binding protein n=1 Tax=Mesorhizobium sp. IMUNJ 23232 TaxID=3376064 RepID=UPI00378BBA99